MTDRLTELLNAALEYEEYGYGVIPVHGKAALPLWSQYMEGDTPSPDQIREWFTTFGERITGLGLITGYVADIAVFDLEADENPAKYEAPPYGLPSTPVAKSGRDGRHYYFKYPPEVRNIKTVQLPSQGIHGDIRADKSLIIAPPSVNVETGGKYEWIHSILGTEQSVIPEWLLEMSRKSTTEWNEKDWGDVVLGAKEGTRHSTTVSVMGKYLYHFPKKDWESFVLPMVMSWNEASNEPPLPKAEILSIFKGIAGKQQAQGTEGTTYDSPMATSTFSPKQLLTVEAILNMPESERPTFLVEDLVPEGGITALTGHPGSGKSWIMLHLAKSVATGESFLGDIQTKKTKVLIVDEESGVWEMRRRMELLGYSAELPIYFFCQNGFKIDNETDLGLLLQTVKQEGIGLVVFDPFVAIHSQDENSADGAQKVMSGLEKLNLAGATVLFIHHHRKNGIGQGAQSMRGSSAFSGRLDSHITVQKNSESNSVQHVEIEHVKSRRGQNVEKFGIALVQESPESPIYLTKEVVVERTSKKNKAIDLVRSLLRTGDAYKEEIITAVQSEADIGLRNIEEAFKSMTDSGELTGTFDETKKKKFHLELAIVQADDEPLF